VRAVLFYLGGDQIRAIGAISPLTPARS